MFSWFSMCIHLTNSTSLGVLSESMVDVAAPGQAFSPSMKLSKLNVHFDAYMYACSYMYLYL